ncbi:hypothetical protein ACIGO6_38815 [Streptomyces sp. NPDC053750]|uniref:hypothetical protein n=1 Tax=Streptomyces sp. NPDC053750 TaxID=3365714 RepID=UPI0037D5499D
MKDARDAQHRPQMKEQAPVEVPGQVVVQAFVQDGAVRVHAPAMLARVVRLRVAGDAVEAVHTPLPGVRAEVHLAPGESVSVSSPDPQVQVAPP